MEKEQNKELLLSKISSEISKMEDKSFKVMFMVFDSEGTPSGSLSYIYQTAMHLKELGYNVQMLYSVENFVGVGDWMGSEYAELPHYNIDKDELSVSPSDFLFIPELFAGVMSKVRELPCKKVVIVQNYGYLAEMMPYGASFETLGIIDCITVSNSLAERIKKSFRNVRVSVVEPYIDDSFKADGRKMRKLIVNVITKKPSDVDMIVKPFMWKNGQYGWVSFRNVRNISKKEFASILKESTITVWADTDTNFGYSALEAMAAGNIVIGKVPENAPEWMMGDEGNFRDNGLWYYTFDELTDTILPSVISTCLNDSVPSGIYDDMESTVSHYSKDSFANSVHNVYEDILFDGRKKELVIAESAVKNNFEKPKE